MEHETTEHDRGRRCETQRPSCVPPHEPVSEFEDEPASSPNAMSDVDSFTRQRIAREEVVLDAMGAFDSFGRHIIMANRKELTKTQVDIVIALSLNGRMSMSHIASALAISKEHVTRAVNALMAAGFVEKSRYADNFRKVRADLTEAGEKLACAIRQAGVEQLNAQLAVLSKEDRETLLAASEQAEAIIRKIGAIQRRAALEARED